jgi:hypothetical protein
MIQGSADHLSSSIRRRNSLHDGNSNEELFLDDDLDNIFVDGDEEAGGSGIDDDENEDNQNDNSSSSMELEDDTELSNDRDGATRDELLRRSSSSTSGSQKIRRGSSSRSSSRTNQRTNHNNKKDTMSSTQTTTMKLSEENNTKLDTVQTGGGNVGDSNINSMQNEGSCEKSGSTNSDGDNGEVRDSVMDVDDSNNVKSNTAMTGTSTVALKPKRRSANQLECNGLSTSGIIGSVTPPTWHSEAADKEHRKQMILEMYVQSSVRFDTTYVSIPKTNMSCFDVRRIWYWKCFSLLPFPSRALIACHLSKYSRTDQPKFFIGLF